MEKKDKAIDERTNATKKKESIYEQKIMQVKKKEAKNDKKAEKKRTNAK